MQKTWGFGSKKPKRYTTTTYSPNGCGDTIWKIKLWKELIQHKYGQEDQWCSEEVTETYGVGVWRTIRNLWLAFRDNVRIKVGRGNKALFWKEDWTGQGSLENLFPGLFSICLNPESKIQEVLSPQG